MVSRCTGCCCSCMFHYRWKQGKWGWVASCLCLAVQSLARQVVCGQVATERPEAKTTPDLDANNFFVNLLRRQGTLLAILCFQCSPEVCHLLSNQGETYKLVVLFFTGYQWSCTGASETYVTPESSKKCKLENPDIKVKKADIEAGEAFIKGWEFWLEIEKSTPGQIYLRSRSLLCYLQIVVVEISLQLQCQKASLWTTVP